MKNKLFLYLVLVGVAIILSLLVRDIPALGTIFHEMPDGLYLVIALIFIVGYGLNLAAPKTVVPSFVWAIFFGIALQPALGVLTHSIETVKIVVELLAALVLFGGGIEVPFNNFKKHFGPIASLSLLGTVLTALLFSLFLESLSGMLDYSISSGAFLLLGALLASTDPTAIIPSLKALTFKRPFIRDLAISESAVNDVVGTILTRFFLAIVVSVMASGSSVLSLFRPFFERSTFDSLALVIVWGVLIGIIGALVLRRWSASVKKHGEKKVIDPALFFAIPICVFALGNVVGGSGFLAAFTSGLLFDAQGASKNVRHFFEVFVDHFVKPIIFILLGALVPLAVLLDSALIGSIAALVFMFVIRPLVVFISLAPWSYKKHSLFSIRELIFLSLIRETGVIPAVLILVVIGSGIVDSHYIFAIGMWVILLTLIIEPIITPLLAKKLDVAK